MTFVLKNIVVGGWTADAARITPVRLVFDARLKSYIGEGQYVLNQWELPGENPDNHVVLTSKSDTTNHIIKR